MRKQPLGFREAEVRAIMSCWQASESCSLIGVGSIGKSNLLHHLSDTDVQAHYMKRPKTVFRAINIDPNMLGPLASKDETQRVWAGYELMMHRLFMSFYPFDVLTPEEARQFYATYQALQDGNNPLYAYMGLRYFELGLEFFLRRGIQIVFLFDEFEELMRQMPVKFFQTLRGLRDQHKGQLSYTTFARSSIDHIAQGQGFLAHEIEPFQELFNDNVVFIGPYSSSDAERMINDLAMSRNKVLDIPTTKRLIEVSGGFAGLLRSLFHVMENNAEYFETLNDELFLSRLINNTGVISECDTILSALPQQEQEILLAVARHLPYSVGPHTQPAVHALLKKQIVRVTQDKRALTVAPPIFAAFLNDK